MRGEAGASHADDAGGPDARQGFFLGAGESVQRRKEIDQILGAWRFLAFRGRGQGFDDDAGSVVVVGLGARLDLLDDAGDGGVDRNGHTPVGVRDLLSALNEVAHFHEGLEGRPEVLIHGDDDLFHIA